MLLIDLLARLGDLPEPRAHYFDDPLHPTAEGHELIAMEIADALVRDPRIAADLALEGVEAASSASVP